MRLWPTGKEYQYDTNLPEVRMVEIANGDRPVGLSQAIQKKALIPGGFPLSNLLPATSIIAKQSSFVPRSYCDYLTIICKVCYG
jgi:hypothetical protein